MADLMGQDAGQLVIGGVGRGKEPFKTIHITSGQGHRVYLFVNIFLVFFLPGLNHIKIIHQFFAVADSGNLFSDLFNPVLE